MLPKSKTRNDQKRLSKSRYSTTFELRFLRTEVSIVKNLDGQKERYFNFLSFEGRDINFAAGKVNYGGLKLGDFATKRGPSCPISADTFWKIQPDCSYEKLLYRISPVIDMF